MRFRLQRIHSHEDVDSFSAVVILEGRISHEELESALPPQALQMALSGPLEVGPFLPESLTDEELQEVMQQCSKEFARRMVSRFDAGQEAGR